MKNKLLKIGVWILIWVAFSIGFVDYLPQHVHMPFSVLISPITSLFELFDELSYPSELATGIFSEEFIFGVVFWVVFFVLLYLPHNRNRDKPK